MVPDHVIATLHPSLQAQARRLAPSPERAEEMLAEAYLGLCERWRSLKDRSPAGVKRWLRSTLYRLAHQKAAPAPDAEDLAMARIL